MFDLWLFRWGNNYNFWGVTIPWTGIGKRFWMGKPDQVPQDFKQTLSYQRIWFAFTITVWVGLAMLFFSAWWVIEDFLFDLITNYFFYPLAVGGVGCNVDELEKSDKAKTEVLHFVSSILTSCILVSTMFSRLSVDRPWCNPLKEEALLWRSFKHLRSGCFDQRCNVNLIMRRVTRPKFYTLSLWY